MKHVVVISPILFIVYFKGELIIMFINPGLDCYIINYYVGDIGYDDDLTMIIPTLWPSG